MSRHVINYDWDSIVGSRAEGVTWPELAEPLGVSEGTLRKAYSRHVAAVTAADPSPGCKILGFDIETAPNTAHVWGAFKQTIHPNQILKTGRVMCFAYRWFSEDPLRAPITFISEQYDNHENMVREAHRLLDEADAVVHYNGARFDVPTLNREFLKLGMHPPSTYQQIDLLQTARRQFRFVSNRLDHLLRDLSIGEKVRHDGHEMWIQCMAGDEDAWARMEEYNLADVSQMESLYRRMLPWISNHPNLALFTEDDRPSCTNCGSRKLHSRGFTRTKTQQYRRFQCQDCGTWNRERFTAVPTEKRRTILTQAV